MNKSARISVLAIAFAVLMSAGESDGPFPRISLVQQAEAIVGVPFSPVSVAGVARRTTRRAVIASSAATTSQQQTATQAQQSTAPAQPSTGGPAIGTVVTTLPANCTPTTKSGVQYQNCNGVFYRAAFQGNNLVYVVTQP